MKIGLRLVAVAMLVAMPAMLVAPPLRAESTLDKVLKEKKIRVAIDVGNPPFGILDKDNQPDGSDVAVARQMAKDMGVELEFVQVPSTGRIPALLAGRADVTIASISVTTDRAKTVMYCNPNGALQIVIFGPKKLPEIARQVGKWMNEFRRASNEFKSQIEQEIAHIEVENRKRTMLPPSPTPSGTTSRTLDAPSEAKAESTPAENVETPATLAATEETVPSQHTAEPTTEALPSAEPVTSAASRESHA